MNSAEYEISDVLASIEKSISDAAAAIELSRSAVSGFGQTMEALLDDRIAPEWLRAHPGRRLPGGHTNPRIQKKRSKALWEWWIRTNDPEGDQA